MEMKLSIRKLATYESPSVFTLLGIICVFISGITFLLFEILSRIIKNSENINSTKDVVAIFVLGSIIMTAIFCCISFPKWLKYIRISRNLVIVKATYFTSSRDTSSTSTIWYHYEYKGKEYSTWMKIAGHEIYERLISSRNINIALNEQKPKESVIANIALKNIDI